jgi:hypothetical protein
MLSESGIPLACGYQRLKAVLLIFDIRIQLSVCLYVRCLLPLGCLIWDKRRREVASIAGMRSYKCAVWGCKKPTAPESWGFSHDRLFIEQ